jgi:hypothetical protein
MLLGIDHIVIACARPDDAVEALAEAVGLQPGGGGRHPRSGTFNRLVWLGDTYLELMGVSDPELARASGIGSVTLAMIERGEEGLAAFAIASDDLQADTATLRATGGPYGEPTPGERERPDGQVVRWLTALPTHLGVAGLPFLIEHEYAGPEWGDAARAERAEMVHPFGGKAVLARLEMAVDHPKTAAKRLHAAVGLASLSEPEGTVDLPVGPHLIRFGRPEPSRLRTTIVIAGTAGQPRSVDVLDCRFLIEVATIGSATV